MKNFEEMDDFEQSIAMYLEKDFNFSTEDAQLLVVKYYEIMERLEWDYMPEEWAEQLVQAIQNDISPEEWMKVINETEPLLSHNDIKSSTI